MNLTNARSEAEDTKMASLATDRRTYLLSLWVLKHTIITKITSRDIQMELERCIPLEKKELEREE